MDYDTMTRDDLIALHRRQAETIAGLTAERDDACAELRALRSLNTPALTIAPDVDALCDAALRRPMVAESLATVDAGPRDGDGREVAL